MNCLGALEVMGLGASRPSTKGVHRATFLSGSDGENWLFSCLSWFGSHLHSSPFHTLGFQVLKWLVKSYFALLSATLPPSPSLGSSYGAGPHGDISG